MLRLGAYVALTLALWAGCAGVGLLVVPSPRRLGGRVGVAACVGLAALLAAGGVAMVLRIPVLAVFWTFVAVGLASLAWQVPGLRRPASPLAHVVSVAGLATFGFLLATQAAWASTAVPNPCDDLLAYIPMTDRLLETGRIVEPWSQRRLQHFGGQPVLQALPVGLFGDVAFAMVDSVIASMFVAGLFLTHGWRKLSSRLLCVGVVAIFSVMAVPRANSSAVLLMVPLLVAVFVATSCLRQAMEDDDGPSVVMRWAVAVGLLVAACMSLRINVAPAAGAVLVVGILTVRRDRWPVVLVAAGTAVVGVVAWSLSMWESSGTPAFPLLPGNLNEAAPGSRDPELHGLGAVLDRASELITLGPYLWAVLGVLVVSLLARRLLPDARLVWIAAVAVLGNMVVLAGYLTVASPDSFVRYVFPLGVGLVVFFVHEVVRALDEAPGPDRLALVPVAVLLLAYVSFALTDRRVPHNRVGDSFDIAGEILSAAGRDRLASVRHGVATHMASAVRADYDSALAYVQGRGRTIAAVDRPYLIDYRRDDIPSLDLPGWAAPGGSFPLFQGTLAKVQFLQQQGFDELIVTVPAQNVCMSPEALRSRAENDPPPAALYSRFYLDWLDGVEEIVGVAPDAVHRFGSLMVIDLDAAALALLLNPSASVPQ